MLKKLVIATFALASLAVATPSRADPNSCLLHAGCFLGDGGWVCPDPADYALCDPV